MTDLYRQAPGSKGYSPQDWELVRRMAPGAMLLWVVPVEPCKHGKIDGHYERTAMNIENLIWCPGAGVGGDDEG